MGLNHYRALPKGSLQGGHDFPFLFAEALEYFPNDLTAVPSDHPKQISRMEPHDREPPSAEKIVKGECGSRVSKHQEIHGVSAGPFESKMEG